MSRKSRRSSVQGWHTLDNYFHVHDRRLDDSLNEGFVLDHNLSFRRLDAQSLLLEGRIWCDGNLFIDVETHLAVRVARGRQQVQIVTYSLHAGVGGAENRGIFRYDNFHAYSREGHADAHHKHLYDHRTWKEDRPPAWIGEERRPDLSDVIEELRQWWEYTGQYLDLEPGNCA